MPSLTIGRWWRRAPSHAIVKSANPTAAPIMNATTAQWGTSAVSSTQVTRIVAGTRSNRRCAKTVPTSAALVPAGASGRWRRRVATRASSPSLPGTTAFAKRPTPKEESTCTSRGWLRAGRAWRIVSRHESARQRVDTTFRRSARTIQLQTTNRNASHT